MPKKIINSQTEECASAETIERSASIPLQEGVVHAGVLCRIAMLSADGQGKITGCDQVALDIFGDTAGEILGKPLADFFLNSDKPEQERRQLQQSLIAGVLQQRQYRAVVPCQTKAGK